MSDTPIERPNLDALYRDHMAYTHMADWSSCTLAEHDAALIHAYPGLELEIARLREQAEALAEAHQQIRSIILSVENRCMAADGPVLPTLAEMTEAELRKIWQASDAALRAYGEERPHD